MHVHVEDASLCSRRTAQVIWSQAFPGNIPWGIALVFLDRDVGMPQIRPPNEFMQH